jgi:hypothetical protein
MLTPYRPWFDFFQKQPDSKVPKDRLVDEGQLSCKGASVIRVAMSALP